MCLFKREEIKTRLEKKANERPDSTQPARILFAPTSLNHYSIDCFTEIYSRIRPGDFDTVVIIESQPGSHEKKLPMPSHKFFTTPFGDVPVNDKLRNELCDEDDDFFIDDEAFNKDLSLFDQLIFLQHRLRDFSVLSLQITDESVAIVKELANSLEEILASRNALLVFCCDINQMDQDSFKKLLSQFEDDDESGMMNTFNSAEEKMNGFGSFFAGLLISKQWKTELTFTPQVTDKGPVAGYAEVKYQPIFG